MIYRLKYEITGPMCFLSHLEIMRLWQRAMLRAKLPIAWTQGFNPRPKLSLGPARNVGIEGLNEYFDAEFSSDIDGITLTKSLNGILPQGVRICEVREIPRGTKQLDAVINEALYKISFLGTAPDDLEKTVSAFMAEESCLFVRKSPKGEKEIDVRSFVNGIEINGSDLLVSVKTGNRGSLRIAELLTVLGYWSIIKDIKIQRIGLFVTEETKRTTP